MTMQKIEILDNSGLMGGAGKTAVETKSKDEMISRVKLLSDEMDANEEENRAMQAEIDLLYAKIDALS